MAQVLKRVLLATALSVPEWQQALAERDGLGLRADGVQVRLHDHKEAGKTPEDIDCSLEENKNLPDCDGEPFINDLPCDKDPKLCQQSAREKAEAARDRKDKLHDVLHRYEHKRVQDEVATEFDDFFPHETAGSEEALGAISNFYAQPGETSWGGETPVVATPMNDLIDAAKNAMVDPQKVEKVWASMPAAAMNQAYRGIRTATQGAQNTMMHESMDVNDLIRQQVLQKPMFMENVTVSPKVRNDIRKKMGEGREVPFAKRHKEQSGWFKGIKDTWHNKWGEGGRDQMKNKKVVILGSYKGPREQYMRGHVGTLKKYVDAKEQNQHGDLWYVGLEDEFAKSHDGEHDFEDPKISLQDVEFLPDNDFVPSTLGLTPDECEDRGLPLDCGKEKGTAAGTNDKEPKPEKKKEEVHPTAEEVKADSDAVKAESVLAAKSKADEDKAAQDRANLVKKASDRVRADAQKPKK